MTKTIRTQRNKHDGNEADIPSATDAIALLESDHRAVEKLFTIFERTAEEDLDAKHALVRRACEELTVHAMIEEQFFYPAAHDVLSGDPQKGVDEAYVEHFLVKTLIEKFESLKPGMEGFDATFRVLMENVRHHIKEEETELFPELRSSGVDLAGLGRKLAERKAQLEARLPKDAGDRT
ncbi:cation-binding protein [Burkholderia pseudomultivorans]|uniref:hemerythrin domain-containing protein n=1 Tax=Burkholderia pseudomultivorans TaxID=1207504 RepID=UPI00075A4E9B|nr:hemerythrin domain-containing protein [Burkholderia pseudomultivorans]AOI94094.1 cation-binding protein [Burkholderia pseudomultivorans]KVC27750.1 cation-binding protein [Burkholderia pseudomultivorans]KVC36872.1 cation-binding protein [Burkholderia pseudomultivorans]KVC42113.1 cation-binding protein [Burkholderia pseudomultivorans]